MRSSLSRSQFDRACKALIAKYACSESQLKGLKNWSWKEHPSMLGLGYMSRVVLLTRKRGGINDTQIEEIDAPEDDAVLPPGNPIVEILTCCQHIVYSPTFLVPAFYFSVHDSNGSPLSLTELVKTSLFRSSVLEEKEMSSFALTVPGASFPLLSQGDHPTTGLPCWHIHPCETSSAVGEVMAELGEVELTEDSNLVRWMEAWCMVTSTMINWME